MDQPRYRNRVRQLRDERGERQIDIAALLSKDQAQVHRWESGRAQMPPEIIRTLANHFGVTRAYLMGWDETGAPNGDDLIPAA